MALRVFLTVPSTNITALAGNVITQIANAQQNPTTSNMGLAGSMGPTGPRGLSGQIGQLGPTGSSGSTGPAGGGGGSTLASGYFSFIQNSSSGSNFPGSFTKVVTYNGTFPITTINSPNDTISLPVAGSTGAKYLVKMSCVVHLSSGSLAAGLIAFNSDIVFSNGSQLVYVGGSDNYFNTDGAGLNPDLYYTMTVYGIWSISSGIIGTVQASTLLVNNGAIEIIQLQ